MTLVHWTLSKMSPAPELETALTLRTVHYTVYNVAVHCRMYAVHSMLYNVQCTLYAVRCTISEHGHLLPVIICDYIKCNSRVVIDCLLSLSFCLHSGDCSGDCSGDFIGDIIIMAIVLAIVVEILVVIIM